MADQVGAYHDNGMPAYWVEEGTGKPYKYNMVNGVEDRSQKLYLSPRAVDPYTEEQAPGGGFFHGGGEWNTETGQWDQPFNWGNLMALGVGGAMAAPLLGPAVSAFGGGAGPSAGASAAMPALSAPASVLPAGGAGMLGAAGTAAGAGAAGAAAPAAAGASGAFGLPSWVGPVASAAVPTIGRMVSGDGGPGGGGPGGGIPPEIMQLLTEMVRRQQNQGPLADAATAQALAGLPRTR